MVAVPFGYFPAGVSEYHWEWPADQSSCRMFTTIEALEGLDQEERLGPFDLQRLMG